MLPLQAREFHCQKTVLFQIIQFSISTQFSSIWSILGATSQSQSAPGSDGNEGVLCIPQSSSITGTSPLDCLVSYPGHSLHLCREAANWAIKLWILRQPFGVKQCAISQGTNYQNTSNHCDSLSQLELLWSSDLKYFGGWYPDLLCIVSLWLEYKLAYYNSAVHWCNHYTTRTHPQ